MPFDKSNVLFPVKDNLIYLAHCGISPLYSVAVKKAVELLEDQQFFGSRNFMGYYNDQLSRIKNQMGALLRTDPDNVAVVKNTSEALSMAANGYPFEPGDEVISYINEYPANHYPWALQERRGVKLKLVPNHPAMTSIDPALPGTWTVEDVERLITPRTKIVAVSHVQFTSGFAADLRQLGRLCRDHEIDLVVDVAQSLGSMPVYPEEYNIAAIASAGWKWLLGPFGIGVYYTSESFRNKLALMQVGAETMQQGFDYLDHSWNPYATAKKFEYSSSPVSLVGALATALQDIHVHYGVEKIFAEIIRLQDLFLSQLDNDAFKPLLFAPGNRSGILSLACPDLKEVVNRLSQRDIVCTSRGGLLRIAPHFYNTDEEMITLAEVINEMNF